MKNTNGGKTKPTAYDVLTAITKNDPQDFDTFCGEYGYDSDSRKAFKIWESVVKEWKQVKQFFTAEELEQLQDIQ